MSAETRIKGQEVIARITRGAQVLATFTTFRSIDIRYQLQVISAGYIGETTERKDDIFKGVSGTLETDVADQEALVFADYLARRAQRKIEAASSRVNVTATFNFPHGQSPRLLIRNLAFGEIGFGISGRDAYVTNSIPFEAEQPRLILT